MSYVKTMTEFLNEDIKVNIRDARNCKVDMNDNVKERVIGLINREFGGDINNLKTKYNDDLIDILQDLIKKEIVGDVVFDGVNPKTHRENPTKAKEDVLNLCTHLIAKDIVDYFN